jgi:hypothetical protein
VIYKLARVWSVNDKYPLKADVLALIAHGAAGDQLSHGGQAVCKASNEILRHYKVNGLAMPEVYFGAFSRSKNLNIEADEKTRLIPEGNYVGLVLSTIEECARIYDKWFETHTDPPKVIILVSDEAHSRRARIVWRTFFPHSEVRIVPVELKDTIDLNSDMALYRKAWTALARQALPTPLWWLWSLSGADYLRTKQHYGQSVA